MYRFTDHSLARPTLTRLWFARLFPLVPRWLAANLITVGSTASLGVVLALAANPAWASPTLTAIVIFVALQVYVAGDHLDGMQAVATATTSPLGDWLDHFCDLWAGCILVFGFWALLGDASRAVLMTLQGVLIVGFGITYAEREERQALHFTRYGTLEAIVLFSLVLLSWTIPAVRDWWRADLVGGYPAYAALVLIALAMGVGAIVVIARRMQEVTPPVALFAAGVLALAIVGALRTDLNPVVPWLLLASYGADYVARVMHGHVVPGRRSWPPIGGTVASVAIAGWVVVGDPGTDALIKVLTIFGVGTLASTVATVTRIVASLRRHWVWSNAAR